MWIRMLPILVIGLAAAIYHVGSKSMGAKAPSAPWLVLTLVYALALILSVLAGLASSTSFRMGFEDLKASLPFLLLLALGCVGIEGGYLLAYRSGWKISELISTTSVVSTAAIFATGILFFGEGITLVRVLGLAVTVAGLVIIQIK